MMKQIFKPHEGVSSRISRGRTSTRTNVYTAKREGESRRKELWLSSSNPTVLTFANERGVAICWDERNPNNKKLDASTWNPIIKLETSGEVSALGVPFGSVENIRNPEDMRDLEARLGSLPEDRSTVVVDASEDVWKIIPAENLIAAAQQHPKVNVIARAQSAREAEVMLGALEAGVSGILLESDSVEDLKKCLQLVNTSNGNLKISKRDKSPANLSSSSDVGGSDLEITESTVTAVIPLAGLSDRVAVDATSLLAPGEGMLVGSFARALFMVHSECDESDYISARPFRVNAGAVHSYIQATRERTNYLSEMRCGGQVMVASPNGSYRTVIIGRAKVERRPMVMIEAVGTDGDKHTVVLQNAETVKLVGPGGIAHSVASIQKGAKVLVLRQAAARHTGLAVDEAIIEM